MPIFFVETDAAGNPLDPVGGFHGPIVTTIDCDWIGREENEEDVEVSVPEVEWPSCRHHRRPDWCITGVRPPRPMPRGLRITIESDESATGVAPLGVIDTELECWAGDVLGTDRNVCAYTVNNGVSPTTEWTIATDVAKHTTIHNPSAYVDRDFILRADASYRTSDGKHWRLLSVPDGYEGSRTVRSQAIPALSIARTAIHPLGTKDRSIVLWDRSGSCALPLRVNLPNTWKPVLNRTDFGPFNLPNEVVLVMEAEVKTVAAVQDAAVLAMIVPGQPDTVSSIYWSLQPAPALPNEYQVFQTFAGAFKTGLYAQAGDLIRMESDQSGTAGSARVVRWFINDNLIHTFDNAGRMNICHTFARWLHGFTLAELERVDFWLEPS